MKVFSVMVLWTWLMASSFVVSGKIVSFSSPLATTGLRFLLALLVITPCLLVMHRMDKQTAESSLLYLKRLLQPELLLPYSVISATLVLFFIGMFVSLQTTQALNTAVIYTLIPLISVAIAWLWLGQKNTLKRLVGFVLGSLGAIVVLLSTRGAEGLVLNNGDLLFLLASVMLAAHVVGAQRWGHLVKPIEGAFLIVLLGTLFLLPVVVLWGDLHRVHWRASEFWLYYLHLTLCATVMTFVLQQWLVKQVGANQLLAYSYTIPAWIALYSLLIGQVSTGLSSALLVGMLLIVIALCLIAEYGKRSRQGYEQSAVTK